MGNPVRGLFDLEVGERVLRMQFSINAMCAIEGETGQGFPKFMAAFQAAVAAQDVRLSDVRLLFWAGLVEHQPETTVAEAGRLIAEIGGLEPAMKAVEGALTAALPEGRGRGGPPGNPPRPARTGRRS